MGLTMGHLLRAQEEMNQTLNSHVDTLLLGAGLSGIRIIASEYLPKTRRVQFRFPRSKKARIRQKWAKALRNFEEVDATHDVYLLNVDGAKTALMHPEGYEELKHRPGFAAVVRNVG